MKFKALILTVFVVFLLALNAQAESDKPGAGPRRGRGKGSQKPNGISYDWEIDLDGSGTLVKQSAFVDTDNNVTYVKSFDEDLKDNNLTVSAVLYDSSQVVAITLKSRYYPCFLTSTLIAYADLVTLVAQINGSQIPLAVDEINLNATSAPLNWAESRDKIRETPSLGLFCLGRRLVETTAATGDVTGDDTVFVKSALALEGKVNLIMPVKTNRPKPPSRPGGRGPGGRRPGGRRPGGRRPGGRGPGGRRPGGRRPGGRRG